MSKWALLVACVAALCTRTASAAVVPVDDFEGAGAPSPWVFGNGPEFPGAQGSFSLLADRGGHVARLAYDFSCTGDASTCDPHYVQAKLTPASPLTGTALALMVRASNASVKIRAVDSTGQTLQYDTASAVPLEASSLDAWHRIVVPLGTSASHWGGANDGTLHPGITSIAVLAEASSPRGTGLLDFDDVAIAGAVSELSGTYTFDPETAKFSAIDAAAADLAPRLGVNIHFTSDDRALDAAQAAGFTWIRMDLGWAGVERVAGSYDFSAFDALVGSAESRAMHTLLILDYGNPLYTGGAMVPPTTSGALSAFGAYAEAAAAHFKGRDVTFEVWNEPDLAGFWPPAPDTGQYEAVLREAIAHVHAGNPSARVFTGGLSSPRPDSYAMLQTIFADGAAASADGVGMHLYVWAPPEIRYEDVLRLRALVTDKLGPVPVACTEWGFNSTRYATPPDGHVAVGRQRQAIMDVREVLMSWRAGLPFVIVYDIRDDGDDPADSEHNFGLLARDYTDKPAMRAIRTLSIFAKSRALVAIAAADDAPPGLHLLRLDGAADSVLVAWTEIDGATVSLSLATDVVASASSMYGDAIATVAAFGRATLEIGEATGPVYVTLKARLDDAGIVTGDAGADGPSAPRDASVTPADAPRAAEDGALSGGEAGPPGAAAAPELAGEASGCGCRASGRPAAPWLLVFAVLAAVVRRGRSATLARRCSSASSTS
jgi:hypothetical protein